MIHALDPLIARRTRRAGQAMLFLAAAAIISAIRFYVTLARTEIRNFYHLPRIKITCERYGIEAFTVPSQNTVPLSMAFNVARERAAFWWYYTNLTRSPTRIVPVRSTDA